MCSDYLIFTLFWSLGVGVAIKEQIKKCKTRKLENIKKGSNSNFPSYFQSFVFCSIFTFFILFLFFIFYYLIFFLFECLLVFQIHKKVT